MRKPVFTLIALALLCVAASAQSKSRSPEQRIFNLGADDPVVQHPMVLSDAELAALATDDLMRRELDQDPPIAKLTRKGLSAAVVHLGSPQERDLIVVGDGAPFMGANVGPFWVIRDLPSGPQVVLSTIALALTIQKSTRYHGYTNIEAFAVTAVEGTTTNFRFNGSKYVLYRVISNPL